jgi:hypothetical protein
VAPIALSDVELQAVLAAARPLARHQRDAFLQAVADELARSGQVGPGVVFKVCAAVQRRFLAPSDMDGAA